MRARLALFLPLFLFFPGTRVLAQVDITDSVMYARDSAIEMPTDPTTLFFQGAEKTKNQAKTILLLKNKKSVSLAAFLKSLNGGMEDQPLYADHGLADLDKDGKKELLIYNYTGGAHCCDEIYIFRNTGTGKYQQAGKLFAGNTVITDEKTFIYDFHEQFGYFFTCFACGVEDSTGRLTGISAITLRFRKGKMNLVPGDDNLLSTINKNLGLLGKMTFTPIDPDLMQDDGLRKEIALNLAVYYFSFNRHLENTRQLFTRHYKHPDAAKIWLQFRRQLSYMQEVNDF